MPTASEVSTLELRVGRVLRGRVLAVVVLLREWPLMSLDGGSHGVAPVWVVVRERADGSEVLWVAAGRELGAGEGILRVRCEEVAVMDRDTFVTRWAERQ